MPGLLRPLGTSYPLTEPFANRNAQLNPYLDYLQLSDGKPWRISWTSVAGAERGPFHIGTDFGCPTGTPIRAMEAGRVVLATTLGGGDAARGHLIIVEIRPGTWYEYQHLGSYLVHNGDRVKRGQLIVRSGGLGHVHAQLLVGSATMDPRYILDRAKMLNLERYLVGGDKAASPLIVPAL